ncbi:IPT/TIG domain-containing protein [Sphingobacterium sp. SYP-B4668]|uniref:IPT/TIG domain-containing protein n=1 Tax=Sphingobacterium sp. SYP-B4668 TaxID=2996035 RepID=UPI0022DDD822|nr:IPT/TIG domain-containing protein [Sphingobacterium sp. SYP-B4668]
MKKLTLSMLLLFSIFSCNKDGETNGGEQTKPIDINRSIEVTDIKPKEGGLGTGVIINGENFGNDTSKIEVYFNEKKALLLKVKPTVIYAMVPKQPGDLSEIKIVAKNVAKPLEAVLKDVRFQYHIKASVTTVAGVFNVSAVKDGPALEANFKRPSFVAVSDDNIIIVSDDDAGRVAALSLQDNKVYTLSTDFSYPWQSSYTPDQSALFIAERTTASKPILFRGLYRNKNWLEPVPFYDQKDNNGNYILGTETIVGMTADQEYVYLITSGAKKLVRVHQQTRKVELIGEKLNLSSWSYLAFNKKDGYVYLASEEWGRVYRFDPKYTPAGNDKPWIGNGQLEHLIGTGRGKVREGVGTSAQTGSLSGISCDADGNVYTCDFDNHVIWKIDPQLNATVVAGTPGVSGYKDGIPKESQFNSPYGVYATSDGILYVADTFNRVIRCVAIQ